MMAGMGGFPPNGGMSMGGLGDSEDGEIPRRPPPPTGAPGSTVNGAVESMLTPELLYKMNKKIAQLTKVVYGLNTRSEELESQLSAAREGEEKARGAMGDLQARLNHYKNQHEIESGRLRDLENQANQTQYWKMECESLKRRLDAESSSSLPLARDELEASRLREKTLQHDLDQTKSAINTLKSHHDFMMRERDAQETMSKQKILLEWQNKMAEMENRYKSQIRKTADDLDVLKAECDILKKRAAAMASAPVAVHSGPASGATGPSSSSSKGGESIETREQVAAMQKELEKYKNSHQIATETLRKLEDELQKSKEETVRREKEWVERIRRTGEDYETRLTEMSSKRDLLQRLCEDKEQVFEDRLKAKVVQWKQEWDAVEDGLKQEILKLKGENSYLRNESNLSDDIKRKLKAFQDENSSLRKEVQSYKLASDEITKVKERLKELEEKNQSLQKQTPPHHKQPKDKSNAELNRKIKELENQNSTLRNEMSSRQVTCNEHIKRVKQLEDENTSVKKELKSCQSSLDKNKAEFEKQNKETEEETTSLQTSLSKLQADHRKQIRHMEEELSSLRSQTSALQNNSDKTTASHVTQINQLQEENARLQRQLQASDSHMQEKKGECLKQTEIQLQNVQVRLQEMQEQLQERTRTCKTKHTTLENDFIAATKEKEKLDVQLKEEQARSSSLLQEMHELKQETELVGAEVRNQNDALKDELRKIKDDNLSLKNESSVLRVSLERSTSENKSQVQTLEDELQSLRVEWDQKAKSLRSRANCLDDEVSRLTQELAEVQVTKDDLQTRLELTESSNDSTGAAEEDLKHENNKLKEEISTLRSELSTKRFSLERASVGHVSRMHELEEELEDKTKELELKAKNFKVRLASVEGENTRLTVEKAEIEANLDEMTEKYNDLVEESEDSRMTWNQKEAGLKEEVTKFKDEITRLRSEATARRLSLDRASIEQVNRIQELEEELVDTNKELELKTKNFKVRLNMADNENSRVKQEKSDLELQLENERERYKNMLKNHESLSDKIKVDLEERVQQLQEVERVLREANRAAEEELVKLRREKEEIERKGREKEREYEMEIEKEIRNAESKMRQKLDKNWNEKMQRAEEEASQDLESSRDSSRRKEESLRRELTVAQKGEEDTRRLNEELKKKILHMRQVDMEMSQKITNTDTQLTEFKRREQNWNEREMLVYNASYKPVTLTCRRKKGSA